MMLVMCFAIYNMICLSYPITLSVLCCSPDTSKSHLQSLTDLSDLHVLDMGTLCCVMSFLYYLLCYVPRMSHHSLTGC